MTALSLTASGSPVTSIAPGAPLVLTATVTAGGASVHLGRVKFCDATAPHCVDGALLGTAQLTSAGTASIVLRLPSGPHSFSAVFAGTTSNATSSSAPSNLTVTGTVSTATSLAFSGVIGNYTLSSTVTSAGGYGKAITGLVGYKDATNGNATVTFAAVGGSASSSALSLKNSIATDNAAYNIAVGDFNGDGLPDVLTGDYYKSTGTSSSISVLLNNGGGAFTVKAQLPVGTASGTGVPVVGDFNGDGKLDFAVLATRNGDTYSQSAMFVFLGNGDGTFTASATQSVIAGDGINTVVGDFNGDGILDIAATYYLGTTGNGVSVLLGKGDGTFTLANAGASFPSFSVGMATGDFNGDGLADLAVTGYLDNTVTILLSKGDGTFTTKGSYGAGNQPQLIVTGDFNNDGILDIAGVDSPTGQVAFLQGVGDGSFVSKITTIGGAATSNRGDLITAADFNGDGTLDLGIANETNTSVQVLLGSGDGTFTAQAPVVASNSTAGPFGIAAADVNGDGTMDFLAAISSSTGTLAVLTNQITTTATAVASGVSLPGNVQDMVVAAYGGDVVYGPSTSPSVTLDVPPAATTLILSAFPSTGPYGRAPTLLATLNPYTNGTVSTDGERVTFLKDGAVVGTGTLMNGVASYTSTALPVGTSTFTATYSGDNTFASANAAALTYITTAPATPTSVSLGVMVGGSYVTSAPIGTTVKFAATVVASGTPVHPGQVRFCDARATSCTGSGLLGVAALQADGTASLPVRLGLGAHIVRAVFAGTTSQLTSTSPTSTVTITGNRATSTTLASSGSTGAYTLSATVSATGSATGPSGSISFQDTSNSNAVVGTAALGSSAINRSFATITSGAAGTQPSSIACADFNRDGIPDAAVINNTSGAVTILTGVGDGTFTGGSEISTPGTGPFHMVAGDFNADGVPDLVVVGSGANANITVLLGKGDGTFNALQGPVVDSPTAIIAADFTGNGLLDLVLSTANNTAITEAGIGDGTFIALTRTAATGRGPAALAQADFNGDGTPDLAVTNSADGSVSILLNNGDGTFLPQAATVVVGSGASKILATDVNTDGAIDLVVTNTASGTLSILLGSNNGAFALKSSPAAGTSPIDVAAVDLNGDSAVDLVVVNSGGVSVLSGDGAGNFVVQANPPMVGTGANSIVTTDVNGDGLADFLVANGTSGNVTVLLSQIATTQTATLANVAVPGAGTHNVDANYSGDSTYTSSTSAVVALTGSTVPTTTTLFTNSTYNSFGQALVLTANVKPYVVGSYSTNGETVNFYAGSALLGSATLSNGTATLSISSLQPGRYTLTAQYVGDANFVASTSAGQPYRVSAAVAPSATSLMLLVTGSAVTTVARGTVVTLQAAVTGAGGSVTPGTVNFCDATARLCTGSALFGTAQLNASGVATLRHAFGVGGYQVVAKFAGDTSFGISTSAVQTLSVPGATTTSISASGTPGNYTLTGTVVGNGSFATPAGTVSFVDTTANTTAFASATLGKGILKQSFATPLVLSNLPAPVTYVQGDFNGDGNVDIFYFNDPGNSTSNSTFGLAVGQGDGTFKLNAISNPGGNYTSADTGDFNGDGKLDLLLTGSNSKGATAVLLLKGNGDGTFVSTDLSGLMPTSSAGGFSVLRSDFNLDGNLDALVVDVVPGASGYVRYTPLLGKGDGTFTAAASFNAYASNFAAAAYPAVADFNCDGLPDIAFAGANSMSFFAGNGDGTFATVVTSTVAVANNGFAGAVADFNGDGILDYAQTNYIQNTTSILLGVGDGTFTTAAKFPSVGGEPETLVTADLNGDGNADLVTSNFNDGTVSVLLGNGDGTFASQILLTTLAKPLPLLIADFNNDGLPDIFSTSSYFTTSTANVFLNTATSVATATASGVNVPGSGIHYVDATFPGSSGYAASMSATVPLTAMPVVTPAPTAATVITLSTNPTTSAAGQAVTISAQLSAMAGSVATTNGEPVTFLNNNVVLGTGTLNNGVASFTTTSLSVGRNSLTAAYNGDNNFSAAVSSTFVYTVTPAAVAVSLTVTSAGAAVTTVPFNTSVLLTATAMNGTTPITPGVVQFCDADYKGCVGSGLLGTAQTNAQGTAKLSVRLGAGTHAINAMFLAQKSYTVGTSLSSKLVVTGGQSVTTLASAGTQGQYSLTATVVASGQEGTPTGSVSFNDTTAGKVLGTAPLSVATQARTFVPGTATILSSNLPQGVSSVDLNGDGILDLVSLTSTAGGGAIAVSLGKGDGTFTSLAPTVVPGNGYNYAYARPTIADFNGDGIPDVAVPQFLNSTVYVYLGNGDGTFRSSSSITAPFTVFAPLVVAGDFNGDGKQDLLTFSGLNGQINPVTLFAGHGDGTFDAGTSLTFLSYYALGLVAGDFNQDGRLDVALIDGNNQLTILLGKGDGTFTISTATLKNNNGSPSDDVNSLNLVVGDFNGDGIPDLASTGGVNNAIDVLLGNGDGTFAEQPSVVPSTGANQIAAGDLNGDGFDDLATVKAGAVSILFSNGDGTFSIQPAATVAGNGGIAIGDFNGDGQPDIAVDNSLTDTVQIVQNTLTETAVAYIANAQLSGGGAHVVNSVYSGDSLFAGSTSNSITLNGVTATPTTLSLTASAASGKYGDTIMLTATLSPTGAPATNGETVTFSSGAKAIGTAKLAGGVATLSTAAIPAGSNSITALFSGDNVYGTSTSNAVPITLSQAASTTTYAPPLTQVYGVTAGAVGILNASGTPAGGTFTYAASSGGTTVPVNASTILPVGTYSLTATYTPSDATDYATSSKIVAGYTVTQATPTISWATPAAITYGTQLSNAQLNATANVQGTFTYSPAAGAVLPVGTQKLSVTFTPADTQDYAAASASVNLQVNQATPVIIWATPAPITYGTALSATQLNATANTPGTFTYSPAVGTVLPAGAQKLTVTFSPSDNTNYTTATASVTIQVGTVAATITWPTPGPITYGTPLSSTQLDATANTAGSLVYNPAAGAILPAGMQNLNVAFTPTSTTMYTAATGSTTLLVNKFTAVVMASASGSPINSGASETITAAIPAASAGAASPTGGITFAEGSTTLLSSMLSGGKAAFTSTALASGTHTIVVTYAGDANYTGGSATVGVVVNPAPLDFTFTNSGSTTQTVTAGSAASFTFSLAPTQGAYPGAVTFTASGLPMGSVATFTPSTVATSGGAQTVAMSVTTTAQAEMVPLQLFERVAPMSLAFLLAPIFFSKQRRKRLSPCRLGLVLFLTCAIGAFLSGCGSSSTTRSPHTSTITVTAASGTIQHSAAVTLTVQ